MRGLPIPPTATRGRARECDQVAALLAEARLVTLVGPGGVGKTRVAIEVATTMPRPVFVDLTTVASADQVLGAVARAVGLRDGGARALGVAVADHLADAEVQIVLDNVEHVLAAADDVAELLAGTTVLDLMGAHLAAGDPEAALVTGLRDLVGAPPAVIDAYRQAPGWAERVVNTHAWPREGRELIRMTPGTDALTGVAVPTLMLVGDVSAEHLRSSTRAVAAALPDATLVELPGQGHAALQAAPDLVADVLVRHLCSLPA